MAEVDFKTGPSLADDSEVLARDYESISVGRQFQSGKRLVQALAISPGERVLDVGCGTGLLAEHIADVAGPAGRSGHRSAAAAHRNRAIEGAAQPSVPCRQRQ